MNTEILDVNIKDVLNLPIYILNIVNSNQTKLSKNNVNKIENEQINTIKKCRIQVFVFYCFKIFFLIFKIQIFFNDILVCTTADSFLQVNSNGGFSALFNRIFSLNVIERLESICLKIRERFISTVNSSWYELAQIFIPISDKFDEKILIDSLIINKSNENLMFEQKQFDILSNKSNETSHQIYKNESLLAMEFASDLIKAGLQIFFFNKIKIKFENR